MSKVYARQIPPEFQVSPLEYCGFEVDNITIFGNKDYEEHMQPVFENAYKVLDNGELFDVLEEIKNGDYSYYKNATQAINDYLPPENKKYSTRDVSKIKKIVYACENHRNIDEYMLCELLEIITGNAWDFGTIRGCCQRDWNNVFYQKKDFPDGLKYFEIEYFNLGTEWVIHDEEDAPETPSDICGYHMYCYEYGENIKNEIAKETGANPDDVILYEFDGYVRAPKYKMVSA